VRKMVSAGATRIGASASVKIIEQVRGTELAPARTADLVGAKSY
jgi:hypothetical protein